MKNEFIVNDELRMAYFSLNEARLHLHLAGQTWKNKEDCIRDTNLRLAKLQHEIFELVEESCGEEEEC